MIYFYYGDDEYGLEEKLKLFKERYLSRFSSGLNFLKVDFSEENLERFRKAVESHSMFEEKKLIFAQDVFALKKDSWENLSKLIRDKDLIRANDVVVVFYERRGKKELYKKSAKAFGWFEKNASCQEFAQPTGEALVRRLKNQVAKKGAKISDQTLRMLIKRVGENTIRLANELEKLTIYKQNETVTMADVELLSSPEIEANIFKTIDALAKRDLARAISQLHDHWANGDDPLGILGMFAYELRVLVLLRESLEKKEDTQELTKIFKIHPFVIKKNRAFAQNFTLDELKRMYRELAKADLAIKTGTKEPQEALEDFILKSV